MLLFEIIVGCLVLLAVTVAAVDLVPLLKDWTLRIRMGRYGDLAEWNKAITEKGVRWLTGTPKIKVTDNTRLVALDMLKGNYSKSAIQHWQEAALVLGLSEVYLSGQDASVRRELEKFVQGKLDEQGRWREAPTTVDGAILAYAILKLDFLPPDWAKPAFDTVVRMICDHVGQDGTVQYRKSMKLYRYVDTIGFICPFLVAYGARYHDEACVELAIRQITEYVKHGMLPGQYIPCHAYHIESKAPLGLYGWGRGLGWFAIGLADSWNELPSGHPARPELEACVKAFAQASIRFQQPNGSWNWTVTRSEARPDSSTTATLAWFLLNASRIKDIGEECLKHSGMAARYLMKATRRNGAVDFSQGDTKDIGVYSMLFNILPFTQGFCIRYMNHSGRGA